MPNLYTQRAAAPVPQTSPIRGREHEMVANNAGGYVFKLDIWAYLDRFLILGTEGGTYYASEQDHTEKSFVNLAACVREDGPRVVRRIMELDKDNRAPKMQTLIFAMAYCHVYGNDATKQAVNEALPQLLRIGTFIFQYVDALKKMCSFGRSKRRGLANVLESMTAGDLAYQMVKYQNREGWTWRDLLRVVHPAPGKVAHGQLYQYALSGKIMAKVPDIVRYCEEAKQADVTDRRLRELILEHGLTHEMIPTARQKGDVLEALAEKMPATALLRQLARLSAAGILKPLSSLSQRVAARISDEEWLRKSRIHPIQILSALTVYGRGTGTRGSLTWTPVPLIVDALDTAFLNSFKHVVPTGKNILIGLDVSGSMGWSEIAGVPGLTPAMAGACLALVTARTEQNYHVMAFSCEGHGWNGNTAMKEIGITAKDTFKSAMEKAERINAGGTDCAQPMLYASKHGLDVDAFVIITDNETWAGKVHVSDALKQYRREFKPQAKLAAIGMTATQYSIADPNDPNGMNFVGFDSAGPAILADFIRGCVQ